MANPFNGPLPTYAQALAQLLQRGRRCSGQPGIHGLGGGRLYDGGALPPARPAGDDADSGLLPRDAQLAELDRHRAAVRHDDGAAGGLRADQQPQREVDPGQRQPDFQSGNGRSVSALGRRSPRLSDVRRRRVEPAHRDVRLLRRAEQLHEADVESLAGERDVHAWLVLFAGPAAAVEACRHTGTVPIDMGNERSLSAFDQRHRAVFNGIYDVGHGFQVSGIYFYGSGQRDQIVCGCDARGLQIGSIDRLRADDPQGPNGSIIPRNSFLEQPIHRVEMRLLQRIPLGGKANLAGSLEVFNLFNRKNYGAYDLTETSGTFLQPQPSANLSYAPRTVQLGFRLTF